MKNTPFFLKFLNKRNIIAIKNLKLKSILNLRGLFGFKNRLIINYRKNTNLSFRTLDIEDYSTYFSIFIREDYKTEIDNLYCIFDFGANIGLASAYFRSKYPNTKIISYEPDPSTFSILKENTIDMNNIIINQSALGKKSGIIKFYRSKTGKTSGIVKEFVNDFTGEVISVRVDSAITLLSKFINKKILIKMDIEGLEMSILKIISKIKNNSDWYIILEKDINFDRSLLKSFQVLNENDLIIYLKK